MFLGIQGGLSSPILFIITTLIWGSTWLAIKGQLGVVSPTASVAYRFAMAAVISLAFCWKRGVSLRFPWRVHLALAGQGACLFSLNCVCVYIAEQYVSSGVVAILFSLQAGLNVLGAYLLFRMPLKARAVLGAMLGIAGVTLIFFPEFGAMNQNPQMLMGLGAGALGVLFACSGNMLVIHLQRAKVPVFSGAVWGMVYGALTSVLAGVVMGVEWAVDLGPVYLLSMLYLSVFGTIVAFLCYSTLLKREGPGPASYVNVLTPVVALLLSTLFENYHWTALAALGAALVFVGNFLAMRKGGRGGRGKIPKLHPTAPAAAPPPSSP